jgi:HEAT repeat protein
VSEGQLDLFAGSGVPPAGPAPLATRQPGRAPADLDDAELLAAIPASGLADGPALAAEAGRRRLVAAIPVLEDYCRRFAGFGMHHALPEQVASLEALGAIGGAEAACSVVRIIGRGWVQGPTLACAVAAAARLKAPLPPETVAALLRHADPAIRADACRLARRGTEVIVTLTDLLGDLHSDVCIGAACALGRMGRPEALPVLRQALLQAPSQQVIEAVPPVADEECMVMLGRIARGSRDLGSAAITALEAVEHPRAARLLEHLRQG